jgi:hypothetical protein
MNKAALHKALSITLTLALIFGQVGASFFHNKHDAHQTVVDLDHTVLVPHGEHCKVCAVDWVHQFVNDDISFRFLNEEPTTFFVVEVIHFPDLVSPHSNGRAPPVLA